MKIEGILYTQQSDLILKPTWLTSTLVAIPFIAYATQNEMEYIAAKRSFNILLNAFVPLAPMLGSYLGRHFSEVWVFDKLPPQVPTYIEGSLVKLGTIYQAVLPTRTWWPVAIISSLAAQILVAKHKVPSNQVMVYQRAISRKVRPIQDLILKASAITLIASIAISISNSR